MERDKTIHGSETISGNDVMLHTVQVPAGEIWYVELADYYGYNGGTDGGKAKIAIGNPESLDRQGLGNMHRNGRSGQQTMDLSSDWATVNTTAYASGGEEIRLAFDNTYDISGELDYTAVIRRVV